LTSGLFSPTVSFLKAKLELARLHVLYLRCNKLKKYGKNPSKEDRPPRRSFSRLPVHLAFFPVFFGFREPGQGGLQRTNAPGFPQKPGGQCSGHCEYRRQEHQAIGALALAPPADCGDDSHSEEQRGQADCSRPSLQRKGAQPGTPGNQGASEGH